jgi:hypothetical protein
MSAYSPELLSSFEGLLIDLRTNISSHLAARHEERRLE